MGRGAELLRLGRLIPDDAGTIDARPLDAPGPPVPVTVEAPGGPPISSVVRPAVRPVLSAVVLLVPLAFAPGWTEVFAPAKFAVLWMLLGLAVMLAVGALLVHVLRTGDVPGLPGLPGRSVRLADVAVAVLLGWTGVALALSTDPAAGVWGAFPEYQGVVALLGSAAVYALARLAVARPADLDRLLAAITVATGVIGAYAILQRSGLDPVWAEVAPRPFATVGQANSLAAVLVLGVPAAAHLGLRRGKQYELC